MKQCRSGIRVGNLSQDEKLCMYVCMKKKTILLPSSLKKRGDHCGEVGKKRKRKQKKAGIWDAEETSSVL